MHDGKSPIAAKAARWEDQHQELWELLVPSSGAAATIQGEVIRISGRINDEIGRNGGGNWDGDYRKMADAFLQHVGSGQSLPAPSLDEARQLVRAVKGQRGARPGCAGLPWIRVALNPEPITLPAPDYER